MRISLTAVFFAFALPLAAAPDTIVVSLGKAVKIGGLTVTFIEVLQDSRCPHNVQCIWAGVAEIRVVVAKGSTSKRLLLSTSRPEDKASAFGRTFELVDLEPYPGGPGQRNSDGYRAKIAVDADP